MATARGTVDPEGADMAHGTAPGSPRVAAQLTRLEGSAQRAHRLYLDHLTDCDACHGETRCTLGSSLHGAFLEARGGQA